MFLFWTISEIGWIWHAILPFLLIHFFWRRCWNEQVAERSVQKKNTRDELLAEIKNATVLIKERRDVLRQATHHVFIRIDKCIDINNEIFENLLWTLKMYQNNKLNLKKYVVFLFYYTTTILRSRHKGKIEQNIFG